MYLQYVVTGCLSFRYFYPPQMNSPALVSNNLTAAAAVAAAAVQSQQGQHSLHQGPQSVAAAAAMALEGKTY